jgi:2-hydroxychromene-2-carboxylate isomerase
VPDVSKPEVDFFFDVVCPYAYLAHTQIDGLRARTGVDVRWRPVLLGGLFRVIGAGDGPMPTMSVNKARLNLLDMHRWADHYGVPLALPAEHPRRTVMAMRAVIASCDAEKAGRALYAAYWRDGLDITDETVVAQVLDEAGLDGKAITSRTSEADIKTALRSATDEAAAAGAFGVPTFVVSSPGQEPELFWGQDRIEFVERAIQSVNQRKGEQA